MAEVVAVATVEVDAVVVVTAVGGVGEKKQVAHIEVREVRAAVPDDCRVPPETVMVEGALAKVAAMVEAAVVVVEMAEGEQVEVA